MDSSALRLRRYLKLRTGEGRKLRTGEGRQITATVAENRQGQFRWMSLAVIPLAFALFIASMAPLQADNRRSARFIDISNNRGGNVLEMVKRRGELARSGKTVRIRGYCRSACTILTTLPNACLGPGATIGFHAPRIPNTSIIPPYVDQIMGNYYRAGIRDRWFGGWNRSLNMNIITARQYVQLDPQTRICKSLRPRRR